MGMGMGMGATGAQRWGERTWTELADRRVIVVLPVGSIEQHGPHLPLDTDVRIAVAVAEGAAALHPGADVAVAPALAYGAAGEHAAFAGTLSIGTAALSAVVVELARGAGPEVAALVVVNGHGGNVEALRAATQIAAAEQRALSVWSPPLPSAGADAPLAPGGRPADAHAGWVETSVLLHLAPELVRVDRAEPGVVQPLADLLPTLRRAGVRAVAPNGVLGDPTGASAELGRRLIEGWIADLAAHLAQLHASH